VAAAVLARVTLENAEQALLVEVLDAGTYVTVERSRSPGIKVVREISAGNEQRAPGLEAAGKRVRQMPDRIRVLMAHQHRDDRHIG
jgi:hypothetical protein